MQVNGGHARIVVVSGGPPTGRRSAPRAGPARLGAVCHRVGMPRPADLVLTGGHVHTVDPALPRAEAVAVARRADRRGRVRRRHRRLDRAADARRRPRRPAAAARLPGRPRPPDRPAGSTSSSATSGSTCGRRADARRDRGLRRSASREGMDRRQRLVHGATSRTARRAARTSTRSCRIGRRSSRTATATRAGSTAERSSSPGIDRDDAGSVRRPDRARPGRDADGHAPRGRRRRSSSA